jgi:hypothetical protein
VVLTSRSSFFLDGPLSRDSRSRARASEVCAYIGDREQISHHLGLLHSYLLHSLDITDAIAEGVDDLNVLDVRDGVPSIAETLDIVTETLIMLLLDGFDGLSSRWTLVCALEVPDEHGTQLVLGVDGSFG